MLKKNTRVCAPQVCVLSGAVARGAIPLPNTFVFAVKALVLDVKTLVFAVPSGRVNRLEFLGRNGGLGRPAALERWGLSESVHASVDPCQALMVPVALRPGQEHGVHLLLGARADRTPD